MANDDEAVRAHRDVPGWTGRYFEDFVIGDRYRHPLGRTITETDNIWMTLLTQNSSPLHFDHHYAAQTAFGRPLVDSTFTLALVTGQSVIDVSQHVFANLGWDEVRLPAPVFAGDTIYSESEVLEARLEPLATRDRRRHGANDRLQSGRHDRDHLPAHDADLSTRLWARLACGPAKAG